MLQQNLCFYWHLLCFVGWIGLLYGQSDPWPVLVPGWEPPQPGEHPRLFFRQKDIPKLRERAKTPEGQMIIQRLRKLLDGQTGESMPTIKNPMTSPYGKQGGPPSLQAELPIGAYTISHAAGYGFLYILTGEKKYADLGKECFEWAFAGVRDRDKQARYSFRNPGEALRAGPSLGWYAVGYDLCYNGWDPAFREKVAKELANYNQGKYMSLAELAVGKQHMPASNHWGMQVGGAALALLALWKDPGVDNKQIESLMEINARCMIRNVTEGFGDHGWFPEGDGTGSMSSFIAYLSAIQAWRVAGGKDFITPRPNIPWTVLKWIFLSLVHPNGTIDCPKRGAYPHNVWARTSISGAGYFAIGFGVLTEEQKSAMLWFYNHFLKERDLKNGTPFDTVSPYPHHTILAFVNWPWTLPEKNPGEVLPKAVRDEKYGFYMFRNRWQDSNDIVISIQTRNTRGWHRANTDGSIWIWGLGKKYQWGKVRGEVRVWQPGHDGSAILSADDGTCLAIDFSQASGAEAVLVMTGPGAGGDPAKIITSGSTNYHVFILSSQSPPVITPVSEGIQIGKQVIRQGSGRLELSIFSPEKIQQ